MTALGQRECMRGPPVIVPWPSCATSNSMLLFAPGVGADNVKKKNCTSEIDMHGGYTDGRAAVEEMR